MDQLERILIKTNREIYVKGNIRSRVLEFSLQKHEHRTEEWTVLEGLGLMTLEEERGHASTFVLTEKSRAIVPKGFIHRLKNISKNKDLLVLEIWWGNKLSEDDIIRYEDEYNRVD